MKLDLLLIYNKYEIMLKEDKEQNKGDNDVPANKGDNDVPASLQSEEGQTEAQKDSDNQDSKEETSSDTLSRIKEVATNIKEGGGLVVSIAQGMLGLNSGEKKTLQEPINTGEKRSQNRGNDKTGEVYAKKGSKTLLEITIDAQNARNRERIQPSLLSQNLDATTPNKGKDGEGINNRGAVINDNTTVQMQIQDPPKADTDSERITSSAKEYSSAKIPTTVNAARGAIAANNDTSNASNAKSDETAEIKNQGTSTKGGTNDNRNSIAAANSENN